MQTKKFGLVGRSLAHSFSAKYLNKRFLEMGVDAEYKLYDLPNIERIIDFAFDNNLDGFNVTMPYKQEIMPYLTSITDEALTIGAVNTVKVKDDALIGYNTDCKGFENTFLPFLPNNRVKVLVLGNGGASKAVQYILKKHKIDFTIVSRVPNINTIGYREVTSDVIKKHKVIINTTSLGMYPNSDVYPIIPYHAISSGHILYDLIYNPEVTPFLQFGIDKKAVIKNGLDMLHQQAEASLAIWLE